jgi:antitoxin HicB
MNAPIPDYPCEIYPLPEGGYLVTFPDLPGCIADGSTIPEAVENAHDAVASWILTAREFGDPVPEPGTGGESGRFVQRLPKSLHRKLTARARQEGVSLNTLVLDFIAEGIGQRESHA